jgi:hypothetical protein
LFSLVTPYTASMATVNLGIGSARLAETVGMGAASTGCGGLRSGGARSVRALARWCRPARR